MRRKPLTYIIIVFTLLIGCKNESETINEIPAPTVPAVKPELVKEVVEPEPEPEPVVIDRGVDLNDKYFLVFASYTVEEFAMAKKDALKAEGFNPEIFMVNEDGWYKLAIESYNTVTEAKDAVLRLQDQYPQLYITKK